MSQAVFDKCLELAKEYSMFVTLGGGEPTLHPHCLKWTMEAAFALVDVSLDNGGPAVLVITNGKKGKVAVELAKLNKLGVISAELSQDRFHEPIDHNTVDAFQRYAGFRDVTHGGKLSVYDVGRASELEDYPVKDGCACSTLFVAPDGDFYACGCRTQKLGNVLTDAIPESYFEHSDECSRERELEFA